MNKPHETELTSSQEDYLTTIWRIVREKQAARATDISRRMGVTGPSVTSALRSLSEKGLVNYAPYDIITLTARGQELADSIERRQKVLRTFLSTVLALSADVAEENANRLEHAVSPVVLSRLTKFIEYYETCPGEKVRFIEDMGYFCEGHSPECRNCAAMRHPDFGFHAAKGPAAEG
ncbi:metal-dependent transcriptional regulator [Spirochaeta lutea]|uniref:metal-dependent transcriptional regulator n=1 Tax=Spirochaeta lutea TaxID=1480694 RepID=UPI00068D2CEC|nr:metal-dependent transcriptional regulator [Spirochaeta lutea]